MPHEVWYSGKTEDIGEKAYQKKDGSGIVSPLGYVEIIATDSPAIRFSVLVQHFRAKTGEEALMAYWPTVGRYGKAGGPPLLAAVDGFSPDALMGDAASKVARWYVTERNAGRLTGPVVKGAGGIALPEGFAL